MKSPSKENLGVARRPAMPDHENDEKLWNEVRTMMDDADEHEQILSSDDDDYAERLMDGDSAPSSVHLHLGEAVAPARGTGALFSVGGSTFNNRRLAAFAGLDQRPSLVAGFAMSDISSRVGPTFSRQAAGFSLSEEPLVPHGAYSDVELPHVGGSRNWGAIRQSPVVAEEDGVVEGGRGDHIEGEEEDEDEDDGWGSDGEVDGDWGTGVEDEGKDGDVDDTAEWSSKTASWAVNNEGSDESDNESATEEQSMEEDLDLRSTALRPPVPTVQTPASTFGGMADLDDLTDDEEFMVDEDTDNGSNLASSGPQPKRPATSDSKESRAAGEGKRVRFENNEAAMSDVSPRPLIGLASDDPFLAGLLGNHRLLPNRPPPPHPPTPIPPTQPPSHPILARSCCAPQSVCALLHAAASLPRRAMPPTPHPSSPTLARASHVPPASHATPLHLSPPLSSHAIPATASHAAHSILRCRLPPSLPGFPYLSVLLPVVHRT